MLNLRDYQEKALEQLRLGFSQGKRAQVLVSPTGSGKTEMAIALLAATKTKGNKAAMLLDRIVLCDQTSKRLERYNIDHGVLQSGHWRYRPYENIQVCSAQTLERRGEFPGLSLLIVDECFPAGTLISTPSGDKDISIVRCGDTVYNATGVGKVVNVMARPAVDLVKLEFEDGTTIECTDNHPIFTDRGWVKAAELEIGRVSYSIEGLHLLWESVYSDDKDRQRQGSGIEYLRSVDASRSLLKILLEEVEKSDEQSGIQREDESQTSGDKASTDSSRRERQIAAAASTCFASRIGGRLAGRACGSDQDAASKDWLSNLLQAGHCKLGDEDWHRIGRWISLLSGAESTRFQEDRISCFPRLVCISRVKRESVTPVFNLHISGHPSYFANGKLVHNCHATREQTVEFIKNNPDVKVIGLTATPFTKGLGKIYDNVVSPVTTKELVERQMLVPLRVFIAKEIDMTGAKKVAGEWSQLEATTRGMKITGDVVAEWITKTHEIFGAPRKTIVFSAGVDHGADLARKFQEQGYNFVSLSYKDDENWKKEIIEDFSKPDTQIQGLIATDILTKGFDVPDVMIGVSARPFSKSLSSHIQQMGRVMRGAEGKEFALWLCLAKGSKVLTDQGLVPIDKVTLDHKIWDGTNFVTHGGAVCNGIQQVITYQGLTATEGHLVHTAEGWRTFGDCAREQIRITQTGFGGTPIRIGEDIRSTSFLAGRKAKEIYSRFVRVRDLWLSKLNLSIKFAVGQNQGVQSLQPAGAYLSNVALQQSSGHASQMLQSIKRSVSSLWGQRNRVQVFWRERGHALDHGKFGSSRIYDDCGTLSHTNRSDRSVWSLRAGQFALAICGIKSAEQAGQSIRRSNAQVSLGSSGNSILRQHITSFLLGWNDGRAGDPALSQAFHKTEREVWDILDAGPHNRFTCEGLLVHNCHSGNYLRFRDDWDEVYEAGVDVLDEGKEKAKKEPTEREKKDSKCPACHALWVGGSDTCYNCGHVRERRNQVSSVAGKMEELKNIGQSHESKQEFWAMMQYYIRNEGWSKGRAANTYRDKFGVWPRGLNDNQIMLPSPEVKKFIRNKLHAFLKSIGRR